MNFRGTALNSTSLNLTWESPPPEHHNGIIREYRVTVTENITGEIHQLSTQFTNIVVSGLHPYFEYVCVVVAVTVDEGPHSSSITIRTNETGKGHNACYVL